MDLASIRLVVLRNSEIMVSAAGQIEGTELLLQRLAKTKTNRKFLAGIAKAMQAEKN